MWLLAPVKVPDLVWVNVVPFGDVSILYDPTEALSSSPHVAPGPTATKLFLDGKPQEAEKVFRETSDPMQFATFDDQWGEENGAYTYAKVNDPVLSELVKKAFSITKMEDYGKFDIRVDQSGRYYFIDSNSNPAFGPKELEVAMATILDMYEVDFPEILKRLMMNTMKEWHKSQEEMGSES